METHQQQSEQQRIALSKQNHVAKILNEIDEVKKKISLKGNRKTKKN